MRGLLARLALDVGRVVTVPTLVDDLWGTAVPDRADNAVQALVSRLRRVLGSGAIHTDPAGYRLALPTDSVDAALFDRLVAEARPAEAAALWRGPALADLAELPFVASASARLSDRRALAVEQAARLALMSAEPGPIDHLTSVLADQPLREPTAALLARCLHAQDRRADALAVLDRTRKALSDQLGVDPGADLAAAHLDILRAAPPPARESGTSAHRVGCLSRPGLSRFVGRDGDLRRVQDMLTTARLVTLTGPGGAGKTRLATEAVAGRDGVRVVELAPLTAASELTSVLLASVDSSRMVLRGHVEDNPSTTQRLLDAVGGRPLLLVLDNCEHLIAAVAALTETLLTHAPRLRVLATSREPLGIAGEWLHPVDALAPDDAGALFAERARAVRPDFTPATAPEAVAEICRRLDGQPLAIELAAARLRMFSPAEIAARLDDRFRLLSAGSRTAPDRHQTLRAVVAWSWDLLTEPERVLARRLAVFAGGATLDAATDVCGAEENTLAALVDKSLVQAVTQDDAPTRYRMLETIKAYAAERLDEAGERHATAPRHGRYFLALAEEADQHLRTADQLRWMGRLRAESDNLTEALRDASSRGDAATTVRLTAALSWYWLVRGLFTEATGWLTTACALTGPAPDAARATSLSLLAGTEFRLGNWAEGRLKIGEARALIGQLPLPHPPLLRLVIPLAALLLDGDEKPILELTGPDVEDAVESRWVRGFLLHMRAHLAERAGDVTTQRELVRAAHDDFGAVGDRFGRGMTLCSLGELEELAGRGCAAADAYAEAVALARELGNDDDLPEFLLLAARAAARRGDLASARAQLDEATRLTADRATDVGRPSPLARIEIARLAGDLPGARTALRATDAEFAGRRDAGAAERAIGLACAHAAVALDTDDAETADAALRRAVEAISDDPDGPAIALIAEHAARWALLRNDPVRAAELLGVAITRRGTLDRGNPDVMATFTAVTRALGHAGAEATIQRGRALSPQAGLGLLPAQP
nr:BTAD domain-containing putative transcriptional regulator [Pseudonocardia spinosispora]